MIEDLIFVNSRYCDVSKVIIVAKKLLLEVSLAQSNLYWTFTQHYAASFLVQDFIVINKKKVYINITLIIMCTLFGLRFCDYIHYKYFLKFNLKPNFKNNI